MGLSDLVVEVEAPDQTEIAEVLDSYYRIITPEGRIERIPELESLDTHEKIIATLLVLEIRADITGDEEWRGATVREIGETMGCGWEEYGFYSVLREQEQNQNVARTRDGLYRIPDVWKDKALERLSP